MVIVSRVRVPFLSSGPAVSPEGHQGPSVVVTLWVLLLVSSGWGQGYPTVPRTVPQSDLAPMSAVARLTLD